MEIVYDDEELERFVGMAAEASPEHPGPDRPLPRRRDRGGRRCRVRRGGRRLHRRGDGAHRRGRRPFGGLVVPDPARDPERRRARSHRGHHVPDRPTARCGRPAEPAVGGQGRADLGARGEPARLSHRSLRREGDRGLARARRDVRAGGPDDRRDARGRDRACGSVPLPPSPIDQRQGRRPSLRPVPGRRHDPRTGDAIDRRGDGDRRRLRDGPREGDGGGRPRPSRPREPCS